MQLDSEDIKEIVQSVLKNLQDKGISPQMQDENGYGVFDRVEDAINAAEAAQKDYQKNCNLHDRIRIVENIRKRCLAEVETLARMTKEETGLGRYEDKILKNKLVIEKTPGPQCLKPSAESGDFGLTLVEHAPYGVIGAITPTTNPTETIINNTISMISGGNGVVYNVHPSSKRSCAYTLQLINKAIIEAGGPANLITMVKDPTMETVKVISSSPAVRMLVGTGGMGLVNALLRSGKKTIGAGAGNPPVIVDETADIKLAARKIIQGASFDNNIICLAEKEVFVIETVGDKLLAEMKKEGAYLLNTQELEKVTNICMVQDENGWHPNKNYIGKNAGEILKDAGIPNQDNCRLVIAVTDNDHPFVQVEQMMPVLPIVYCKDLDTAICRAKKAEHGNRHTAAMYSQNLDNLTRFAREIETTIFVKNAVTLAGVGFEGEGFTTMTIAGPTGEGITCAKSFTRQRRCVLGDGGFRII